MNSSTKSLDNCLFSVTVSELASLARKKDFLDIASKAFLHTFGEEVSTSERRSWSSSFPALVALLDDPELSSLPLLIEFRIQISPKRPDVVFVARTKSGLKVFVLELKAWSGVERITNNRTVWIPKFNRCSVQHPSDQVSGYAHLIKNNLDIEEEIFVSSASYLYNFQKDAPSAGLLFDKVFEEVNKVSPLYFADSADALRKKIKDFFGPPPYSWDGAATLLAARYIPNETLVSQLRDKFPYGIDTQSSSHLSIHQLEDQAIVFNEIDESVVAGKKKVILIEGAAGSGKSLVATNAGICAINRRQNVIVVSKNMILSEVINNTLSQNEKFKSIAHGDFMKSLQVLNNDEPFAGIIVDEAQRLSKSQIRTVMARSIVSVFCFDERQRLQLKEEGTKANFIEMAGKAPVSSWVLAGTKRLSGGVRYLKWVDKLLEKPSEVEPFHSHTSLARDYSLRTFDTLPKMIEALAAHRDTGKSVALAASFTETRAGLRVQNPPIRWCMPATPDYRDFWVNGQSNELNSCCSVYGCQSLEAHYVGVIWGRDLVYRSGKLVLHEKPTITDNIGGSGNLEELAKKRSPEAVRLLLNRYYVLLTRGALGTFLYCEDEETREWLTPAGELLNR